MLLSFPLTSQEIIVLYKTNKGFDREKHWRRSNQSLLDDKTLVVDIETGRCVWCRQSKTQMCPSSLEDNVWGISTFIEIFSWQERQEKNQFVIQRSKCVEDVHRNLWGYLIFTAFFFTQPFVVYNRYLSTNNKEIRAEKKDTTGNKKMLSHLTLFRFPRQFICDLEKARCQMIHDVQEVSL